MMKKGFTLIELSLSIVFISILSITIVIIIMNTVSSYHRGLTLSHINTVGMELVDDMRATIQNASSRPLADECGSRYKMEEDDNGELKSGPYKDCVEDGGKKFVLALSTGENKVSMEGGRMVENAPLWGVFCTGRYSYLWNSGYFFNNAYTISGNVGMVGLAYPTGSESGALAQVTGFKLLKVQDDTRRVCSALLKNDEYSFNDEKLNTGGLIEFDTLLDEQPIDILASANEGNADRNNLAIYDLTTGTPASSEVANGLFYSVSFILGTVQGGVNVMAAGNFCATPDDYSENFDYCAINKFNFAVQATGG